MRFQSSPVPKERCDGFSTRKGGAKDDVSILTGPEGPVQQTWMTAAKTTPAFQSSPVPKDRCNSDRPKLRRSRR